MPLALPELAALCNGFIAGAGDDPVIRDLCDWMESKPVPPLRSRCTRAASKRAKGACSFLFPSFVKSQPVPLSPAMLPPESEVPGPWSPQALA
eukprot:5475075-Pyramimonas_sp.AAC.1